MQFKTVLYKVEQRYAVQYSSLQSGTALCSSRQFFTKWNSVMQFNTVLYKVEQRYAVQDSSLQSGTALCSSIQFLSWNYYGGFHIGNQMQQQHLHTHMCTHRSWRGNGSDRERRRKGRIDTKWNSVMPFNTVPFLKLLWWFPHWKSNATATHIHTHTHVMCTHKSWRGNGSYRKGAKVRSKQSG